MLSFRKLALRFENTGASSTRSVASLPAFWRYDGDEGTGSVTDLQRISGAFFGKAGDAP